MAVWILVFVAHKRTITGRGRSGGWSIFESFSHLVASERAICHDLNSLGQWSNTYAWNVSTPSRPRGKRFRDHKFPKSRGLCLRFSAWNKVFHLWLLVSIAFIHRSHSRWCTARLQQMCPCWPSGQTLTIPRIQSMGEGFPADDRRYSPRSSPSLADNRLSNDHYTTTKAW